MAAGSKSVAATDAAPNARAASASTPLPVPRSRTGRSAQVRHLRQHPQQHERSRVLAAAEGGAVGNDQPARRRAGPSLVMPDLQPRIDADRCRRRRRARRESVHPPDPALFKDPRTRACWKSKPPASAASSPAGRRSSSSSRPSTRARRTKAAPGRARSSGSSATRISATFRCPPRPRAY